MTVTEPPIEVVGPPAVAMALVQLSECLCEQLRVNGAGETCWCGVYPGAIVEWNYCGGECSGDVCGMGWVRLGAVFPYSVFPTPVVSDRCTLPLAWAVEVGALRCMPQTPDGSPVDAAVMTDVALKQVLDARAMYLAMQCCDLAIAGEIYTPTGPQGGCVGGYWTGYLEVY